MNTLKISVVVCFLISSEYFVNGYDGPNRVLIGALIESGSESLWRNNLREIETLKASIDSINAQPWMVDTHLDWRYQVIKCDTSDAIIAVYRLLYEGKRPHIILGPSCQEATRAVALIAEAENLVQVSYGATTPALSEREKYKNFMRLSESESSHNAARLAFLQHFGWNKVALLNEDLDVYKLAFHELQKELQKHGVKTVARLDVKQNDIKEKLKQLYESDSRIIFANIREELAVILFCEAYKRKMFGRRYVWILPKMLQWQWWRGSNVNNCTNKEMDKAVDGYFSIASATGGSPLNLDQSNFGADHIISTDRANLSMILNMGPYAGYIYDAVWAIALTVLSVSHIDSGSRLNASTTKLLLRNFQSLHFRGLTGPVSFKGPDRVGASAVFQNFDGQMRMVAMIQKTFPNYSLLENCSQCFQIQWSENSSIPPVDGTLLVLKYLTIPSDAFFVILCACVLGTILAVAFLAFNCHFRYLKYIKLSSPKLNNVAVLGCILIYFSIIIMGLDDAFLNPSDFKYICPLQVLLYPCGFTLQFGSMFAKTFRIYVIFRKAYKGVLRKKLLRDGQLLTIIGVLVLIDLALSTSWLLIDPSTRKVTNLTHLQYYMPDNQDVLILPQRAICISTHFVKWMIVQCLYKAVLLLFGVYMAWSTRKVQIPALNDSRFIGFSVYNVVLSNTLFLALYLILQDRPAQLYIVSSVNLVASTTATLLILFVPKIYTIAKHNGNPIVRTSSNTFHVSNARTLTVFGDKNESFTRARIQNRVFKTELEKLRREAKRLTTIVSLPLSPYPRLDAEFLDKLPEKVVDYRAEQDMEFENDRRYVEETTSLLSNYYTEGSSDSGIFSTSLLNSIDDEIFTWTKKENKSIKAGLRGFKPYVPYMMYRQPENTPSPSGCPAIAEESGVDSVELRILRRQSSPDANFSEHRRTQRRHLRAILIQAREEALSSGEFSPPILV